MTDFKQNPEEYLLDEPKADLLSQISAEDTKQEEEKRAREKSSVIMNGFVQLMRLTFYFDEFRRKNQQIFTGLSVLWALLISFVYFSGLCAFLLLVYSYFQFPTYIRNFFEHNKISVQNLEIPEYTFSKIELKNLQDADGTYIINSLIINSTFSDFLQRRVKSVVLDGVTIKVSETKDGLKFGNLPNVLVHLNNDQAGGRPIKIDTIAITNAKLELNGRKLQLPISFSLTGVYESETKISIPFFVKQKEVDAIGTLTIAGTPEKMTWTLDISGTLTLPRHSPENMTGKLTVESVKRKISKIDGHVSLVYGKNNKKFTWSFQKEKDVFAGLMEAVLSGVDLSGKNKELASNIKVKFDGISFTSPYLFESTKPIHVTVQSLRQVDFGVTDLKTVLNGHLKCGGDFCSYVLTSPSPVSVQDVAFIYENDTIRSVQETTFSLIPTVSGVNFLFKESGIDFDFLLNKIDFIGYKNALVSPVSLQAEKTALSGTYKFADNTKKIKLNMEDLNYDSLDQKIYRAVLAIDDFTGDEPIVQLNGGVLLRDNPLLNLPALVSLDKKGVHTKAVISVLDNKVRMSFSGVSKLSTGEFSGSVYLYPFNVADIQMRLNQLSPLFSKGIRNASGVISAVGQASWGSSSQVKGPLYVAFKDVSFTYGNSKIQGLNSVLTFQNLNPLITADNQKIAIKQIASVLPFDNIIAHFRLDNQFIRLADVSTSVAGIDLKAAGMLLPYKASNMVVYLKNNAIQWQKSNPALKKAGLAWDRTGTGSISLPLEFKDKIVSVKNAEVKMSDITLKYLKKNKVRNVFLGPKNTSYQIRSGTILASSAEGKNALDMHVTTTGRLMPSDNKKNLREVMVLDINSLIESNASFPVPADITRKLKVVMP